MTDQKRRYTLRHVTHYDYTNKVELGSHILHLTPRALPGQEVLATDIGIDPPPTRIRKDRDCFGNIVHFLFFDWPHRSLEVTATAEVTVGFAAPPEAGRTMAWETIRDRAMHSVEAADFLFASPMIALNSDAADYVASSFPPGKPVMAGLIDLTQRIYRDFSFRPGSTHLNTPISDVLARRCGVCQDFTNLMISGLRGLGLPARYVSGYIRNEKSPEQAHLLGADQSHAWVECWLGPDHGWIGLDPTNGITIRADHIVLAWGRDYGDVSPVRGVILGGGRHKLTVRVDVHHRQ